MHLHIGTEPASGNLRVFGAGLGNQQIEQFRAQRWWRGTGKAWAQAALGVGGQGELRHQQQAAATIAERQVHLASRIAEHAVVEQLVQNFLDTGRGVLRLDAHQRQQALINRANYLTRHFYSGATHPLNQCLHASSGDRLSRRRARSSAARTRASVMPTSAAECPASRMICSSLFGQAWCSAQALSSGQITS